MQKRTLPKLFFQKPTTKLAKDLLGLRLTHETPEGTVAAKIVETEAYLQDDPAAHTFGGTTERNRAMFGPPGHAYVYFTYGMYWCLNCTANKEGVGEGILLRAAEPLEGIAFMQRRRGKEKIKDLCSGPAKLAMAMGVSDKQYGVNLASQNSPLRLEKPAQKETFKITATTRVGISKAKSKPYRFYIAGSGFISQK